MGAIAGGVAQGEPLDPERAARAEAERRSHQRHIDEVTDRKQAIDRGLDYASTSKNRGVDWEEYHRWLGVQFPSTRQTVDRWKERLALDWKIDSILTGRSNEEALGVIGKYVTDKAVDRAVDKVKDKVADKLVGDRRIDVPASVEDWFKSAGGPATELMYDYLSMGLGDIQKRKDNYQAIRDNQHFYSYVESLLDVGPGRRARPVDGPTMKWFERNRELLERTTGARAPAAGDPRERVQVYLDEHAGTLVAHMNLVSQVTRGAGFPRSAGPSSNWAELASRRLLADAKRKNEELAILREGKPSR